MNEFYVDNSTIHGKGCFTRIPIKKGERYAFHVLPVDKPHNLWHSFPYSGSKQSCIVLSEFSYCNHSKTPNFEMIKLDKIERTFTFEALEDIPEYSEITINYK